MPIRGERLNRPSYEILRSLHGGRVGELFLCKHHLFDRLCVQKTYSIMGVEDSIAYTEPRLLSTIDHPHIVPVFEAQYDPDYEAAVTFVMAYYEGGSVEEALIEGYRFSLGQAVRIALNLLEALAHVHMTFRYVHRDVKSGNVFLDASRQAGALGDFGTAARMETDGTVAVVSTTLLYMASENGDPLGRIDLRADIYGAGLTLFEMLNGRFPYETLNRGEMEQRLRRGLRPLPDRAYLYAPHVPAGLRRVVNKSIARAEGKRFASAGQMINALDGAEFIDWRQTEGAGLVGTWEGTWPPTLPARRRRSYRVKSERISRGSLSLAAYQRVDGANGWRRFGVADSAAPTDDAAYVARFFEDVASRAAQVLPAR